MLDQLREFLSGLAPRDASAPDLGDPRVAAAALMFHVGNADGLMSSAEAGKLRELLESEYGLTAAEAARIAKAGRQADAEAVDLYAFTSVIMAHASEAERVRFVELLWDMTYTDGELHEMEDNLIWRIAELLGVSSRDRMLGKRDARLRAERDD